MLALTGAGCSTESGIPDYRGPQSRQKKRNPIQYQEFVRSQEARARYWARSYVGWPRFLQAQPNDTHYALAQCEQRGLISGIITQNVDRLHHQAGSQHVVELHGALEEVRCLSCQHVESRHTIQERLQLANPQWHAHTSEYAPDGDAELAPDTTKTFQVPACPRCQGILKPNVVFFGENVPKPIVAQSWAMLEQADVLLVLGSSLTVFSGYRFVRGAEERNIPVVIVNMGETRGDKHASLTIEERLGLIIPTLYEDLLHKA